VLAEVWGLIIASNVLCPSCRLMYSVDGLNAHAPGGICGKALAHSDGYDIRKIPVRVTHISCYFAESLNYFLYLVPANASQHGKLSAAASASSLPLLFWPSSII
jgi:hypothetical protein